MIERSTLGAYEVTLLDPNIIVFHNVLTSPEDLIKHYERTATWKGWYGFGRQVDSKGKILQGSEHFPDEKDWDAVMVAGNVDPYRAEIAQQFHRASAEYVKATGIELPNWTCKNWSLARYIPDEDLINREDLTMNYHTDYMAERADQPGEKFGITAVLYPNDDYTGGEISFTIVDPETGTAGPPIDYKPVKGDFVFFPSKYPYYHGVRRIWGAAKYIVRLYWHYDFAGSPEWHALHAKYGERFQEMEQERTSRHDLTVMAPFMREIYTLSEYYSHLEAGTLPAKREKGDPDHGA
jgi:hypothetical protein